MELDWVKSLVGYYRLLGIATGDDAMEVMFKRADALAGELGTDGFIPDAYLPYLTRRPAQARKTAEKLAATDLWVRVPGGYLIVDWVSINAEGKRLQDKRKRDRDRKRVSRAAGHSDPKSDDTSADESADGHEESLYESERKSKKKRTAAAAAVPTTPLPPSIEILRNTLEAHKLVVRWDTLSPDQIATIERLIDQHGDAALVASARRQYQPNRPVSFAQAWLGAWLNLQPPGVLALVADPCPIHANGTTTHCIGCAADRLAGDMTREA